MMKNIFLLMLLAAMTVSSYAQDSTAKAKETEKTVEKKGSEDATSIGAAEPKKKRKAPVQITADQAEFDDQAQEVRYKGNVIVDDNGMKMTCEVMTVFLTKKKEISRIVAKDDVVIVRQVRNKKGELERMTAISDQAEYFQKDEKIVLLGNAELERGTEKLKSPKIVFFRNSNLVQTGVAHMVFNAESAGESMDEKSNDDVEESETSEAKKDEKAKKPKTVNPLLKKKEERGSAWGDTK